RSAEQGGVKRIADVAVFLLQDAERTGVAGQFVEIEADERDQRGYGNNECQAAEDRKKGAPFAFHAEKNTEGDGNCHHSEKRQLHGTVRQAGDLSGDTALLRAEQAAAA